MDIAACTLHPVRRESSIPGGWVRRDDATVVSVPHVVTIDLHEHTSRGDIYVAELDNGRKIYLDETETTTLIGWMEGEY